MPSSSNRSTKRVFIYVRVSTQEQAHEGYSIDEQIDRLKAFCDAHRWTILNVYTDAGYSGAKTDRPALQDMLKNLKKADAVVVYKLDRLSRSQKDTLELIEDHFLKNGVDFISMSENFDTGTPFGRAMIGILAVFAQLEREQIKERMSMGRVGRAKEGRFHGGGESPIGYDYYGGELHINEFEAMQIREIHRLYQSGKSFRQICREFDEKGYTEKHGKWTSKTMKDVMLNSLYIGQINYLGEAYKGIHEPIIDEDTFNRTVSLYRSKDNSQCRNTGKSLLGGLLFCKQCGARYAKNSFNQKSGKRSYYMCHSRAKKNFAMVKNPSCKNKNYPCGELDKLVLAEIEKLSVDPSAIKEIRKESSSDSLKSELIISEIEKIDRQRSRFLDLYGLGKFSTEELISKVEPLEEQKRKLEQELNRLSVPMPEEEAIRTVSTFADVIASDDFDRIRLLVRSLISRIEIDGEDIFIHWKFA